MNELVQLGTVTPRGHAGRRVPEVENQRKMRPTIYWYLSFRCNLACKHCSVESSPWVDTTDDLTTEQAMVAVDQMAELNAGLVIMTGGEIMLRPDALTLIRALTDRGLKVALETNGLRFHPDFFPLAKELQEKKLLVMSISLDGGTKETHETLRGPRSFDRTMANLRKLKEHGIIFSVQAVINRSNYLTIPHLYALAKGWAPNLRLLQFMFLNPLGRGIELVDQLGIRAKDFSIIFELIKQGLDACDAQVVVKAPPAVVPPRYLSMVLQNPKVTNHVTCQFPLLGVLPNGDVTICALSRNNEDLYFGNIENVKLRQVWEETRMDMLRSRYVASDHLTGICGDCVFQHVCKGGCRAWAFDLGGSFDSPLPVCAAMEKAGEFPDAYRVSKQNAAVAKHASGVSCACH